MLGEMKIGSFRNTVLAAAMVFVGLCLVMPSAPLVHPFGSSVGMHGQQLQSALIGPHADSGDPLDSTHHDGCCGTSSLGCCSAPCLLIPSEPVAAPLGARPVPYAVVADAADGIPPAPPMKPPRQAAY